MSRVTLTLPDKITEAIRAEAKLEDRPISSVARRAFYSYFGISAASATKRARRSKATA